jgi:hypothetical protein
MSHKNIVQGILTLVKAINGNRMLVLVQKNSIKFSSILKKIFYYLVKGFRSLIREAVLEPDLVQTGL